MTMASSYFVSLSVLLLHFDWDFFFFFVEIISVSWLHHRLCSKEEWCIPSRDHWSVLMQSFFFFFFPLLKLRQSFIFMTQAILHTPNIRKKLQLPLICSMLTTNNKIKQKKKFFLIIFFIIGKYHISICWRFCPNPFGMERVTL